MRTKLNSLIINDPRRKTFCDNLEDKISGQRLARSQAMRTLRALAPNNA
jgi:hypothetical protein